MTRRIPILLLAGAQNYTHGKLDRKEAKDAAVSADLAIQATVKQLKNNNQEVTAWANLDAEAKKQIDAGKAPDTAALKIAVMADFKPVAKQHFDKVTTRSTFKDEDFENILHGQILPNIPNEVGFERLATDDDFLSEFVNALEIAFNFGLAEVKGELKPFDTLSPECAAEGRAEEWTTPWAPILADDDMFNFHLENRGVDKNWDDKHPPVGPNGGDPKKSFGSPVDTQYKVYMDFVNNAVGDPPARGAKPHAPMAIFDGNQHVFVVPRASPSETFNSEDMQENFRHLGKYFRSKDVTTEERKDFFKMVGEVGHQILLLQKQKTQKPIPFQNTSWKDVKWPVGSKSAKKHDDAIKMWKENNDGQDLSEPESKKLKPSPIRPLCGAMETHGKGVNWLHLRIHVDGVDWVVAEPQVPVEQMVPILGEDQNRVLQVVFGQAANKAPNKYREHYYQLDTSGGTTHVIEDARITSEEVLQILALEGGWGGEANVKKFWIEQGEESISYKFAFGKGSPVGGGRDKKKDQAGLKTYLQETDEDPGASELKMAQTPTPVRKVSGIIGNGRSLSFTAAPAA